MVNALGSREGVGIKSISLPRFVWDDRQCRLDAGQRRSGGQGEFACDTVGLRG